MNSKDDSVHFGRSHLFIPLIPVFYIFTETKSRISKQSGFTSHNLPLKFGNAAMLNWIGQTASAQLTVSNRMLSSSTLWAAFMILAGSIMPTPLAYPGYYPRFSSDSNGYLCILLILLYRPANINSPGKRNEIHKYFSKTTKYSWQKERYTIYCVYSVFLSSSLNLPCWRLRWCRNVSD